jgi:hypothetical protein
LAESCVNLTGSVYTIAGNVLIANIWQLIEKEKEGHTLQFVSKETGEYTPLYQLQ